MKIVSGYSTDTGSYTIEGDRIIMSKDKVKASAANPVTAAVAAVAGKPVTPPAGTDPVKRTEEKKPSRADWIRAEFAKGRPRKDIAAELGIAYQSVFAATKGLVNEHHKPGDRGRRPGTDPKPEKQPKVKAKPAERVVGDAVKAAASEDSLFDEA